MLILNQMSIKFLKVKCEMKNLMMILRAAPTMTIRRMGAIYPIEIAEVIHDHPEKWSQRKTSEIMMLLTCLQVRRTRISKATHRMRLILKTATKMVMVRIFFDINTILKNMR